MSCSLRLFVPFVYLALVIPACVASAQTPAQAPAPAQTQGKSVSCRSSYPAGQQYTLQPKRISQGRVEYAARLKMWSPSGNDSACYIRQIVFSVGRMVNDLPQGKPLGPVLTVIIEHGLFHRRSRQMLLYPDISIACNGSGHVEYTVNAYAAENKKEIYYARISVIGKPLPEPGQASD